MQIKKGDRGNEVVDIQRRLSVLGFDLGPTVVDGAFEEKTEAAVKDFQLRHDLDETGIVDTATWRALVDATYRLGDRALYLRSPFLHGHDVFQLQRWLNTLGFHRELVDGIFGPSTERSVREFQVNFGLFPDGIVGPATVHELFNLRKVLEKDEDSSFPKQPASSYVSGIKGKKIAIGCGRLKEQSLWDWPEESGWHHIDLAYRFSNLLELLGAEIIIIGGESRALPAGEIALLFNPRGNRKAGDIITINHGEDKKSKKLAEMVASELTGSLKERIKKVEIKFVRSLKTRIPRIDILTDQLAVLEKETQLKQDVLKQKIAGAIFDGLIKYFESSGNPA